MPDDEYRFWGEKPPRTVDDPQIVEKVLKKWGAKLPWVKSAPATQGARPEGKRVGKKSGKQGVRAGKPAPSRGVM